MAENLNVLAYDLGSSGARVVLGGYDGRTINLENIHEFVNRPIRLHGSDFWDILGLYAEALLGLGKASSRAAIHSIAFSTWGVDYGLLDERGSLINQVRSYRDNRTEGLYEEIFKVIDKDSIYLTTGIMFIRFNTLVQLYADLIQKPYLLENASSLLLIPDLFSYYFSKNLVAEITISSTTQMFNPVNKRWAAELLKALGIPTRILRSLVQPGDIIGTVSGEHQELMGVTGKINVVAAAGHDTASALAAVPLEDAKHTVFISAGTWSLLGMELDEPVLTAKALNANFTNEMGVGGKIAFHKIIAGMWLTQGLRRDWQRQGKVVSYEEMTKAANLAVPFSFYFDPDAEALMNPLNMSEAIIGVGKGITAPSTIGEFSRAVYESLALNYRYEIEALQKVIGSHIKRINIVSGGSRSALLCQMVADATECEVVAGPFEATSLGNVLVQLVAAKEIASLSEGREIIKQSFALKVYTPCVDNREQWDDAFRRFVELKRKKKE